jgi:hypothetical protein
MSASASSMSRTHCRTPSCPRYSVVSPSSKACRAPCNSTSGSSASKKASISRRLYASMARLNVSTFSCDIATQYPPATLIAK